MSKALVDRVRRLPFDEREAIISKLTARQAAALRWAWREFLARPDEREPGSIHGQGQIAPPGDWTWWANIGGRASGKTETCSRWIDEEAQRLGRGCIIHLVGQTLDDARATMVEGPSGLLAVSPPWSGIDYKPSVMSGTITWKSGARARIFGADKPRKGRGPQCNRMWLDDPAAFGKHGLQVLEQFLLGFRLRAPDGSGPRGAISSTPLDSELLRWILAGEYGRRRSRVVYSRSTTDDNKFNLAKEFFDEVLAEFAGTELEQQERFGRYNPWGAPKVFREIDFNSPPVRVDLDAVPERFVEAAVWIDPSQSTSTRACEVGIAVGGIAKNGHIYIINDLSGVLGANEWPERAHDAFDLLLPRSAAVHFGVEINRGGNQPGELLRSAEIIRRLKAGKPGVSIFEIRTVFTNKGKAQRATPLPRLYKAGQVHHVPGMTELERQMRELDDNPDLNRDRADAAVYLVLDLAGVLDHARTGHAVGGDVAPAGTFGPPAQGSVNVGPSRSPAPVRAPATSFAFGSGRWR